MPMSPNEEVFIKKFVMWVGFFGGFFLRAGVDPEGEVVKALISVLPISSSHAQLLAELIGLILITLTLIELYKSFSSVGIRGIILGIIAIIIAFIGGLIISSSPLLGVFLLFSAVFLARFAWEKAN
jgi:hypothetical protein